MKTSLDKKEYAGPILTDLTEVFDSINNELKLAKLNTYGFDKNSLEIMRTYLRTKLNEQKLMQYSVLGLHYIKVYRKALHLGQFCLIYF